MSASQIAENFRNQKDMLQREIEESKRQDNIRIQKQYYITKKMEEFMDQYFSQMKN